MLARVEGGTGGGRKRPLSERRTGSWTCAIGHANPAYATRCLVDRCNRKRP